MEQDQRNVFSSFPQSLNEEFNMVKPTYDQFIIKPPDRNKTHGPKIKRMIVDSRERDEELYPDPSKYILDFEHEYRDVISMELSQANIPHSFYNIYHHYDNSGKLYANNILHVHLILSDGTNKSKNFEFYPGKYTDISLNSDFYKYLTTTIANSLTKEVQNYLGGYIDDIVFKIIEPQNKIHITYTPNNSGFKKIQEFYFQFLDQNTCPTLNPNVREPKKYPKYSIGPILGFNKKNVGFYNGAVYINNNDKNLYGIATDFISDFGNCNVKFPEIILQSENGTYTNPLVIDKIINKNHLILKDPYSYGSINGNSPSLFIPSEIIAPNVIELICDKYIILDIRELHRLKSNTDSIDDRFAVIPINYEKCSTILNIGTIPTQREIKYFNPPFARLAKLRVAFYRYNGDPLFFNGVNHLLDFSVTALNQASKYNNINSGTINN